jgi:DNA-binding transcriptional LysR family regulator
MDLRKIEYFLAVAEEGQITAAARRLNMAQPPLSHQIKLLEEELGMQLIERGSRRIRLTEAGNLLRLRGEQILDLVQTTTRELHNLNMGAQGVLNLGTVASSGASLLPQRIQLFHEKYPQVNFQIWEGETHRILELLNSGVIEIGIVRTPFFSQAYEWITLPTGLSSDPMVAVASVYWKKDPIQPIDLKDKPLIIHRRYEANILAVCKQAGFDPRIFCKSDDIRSMLIWADNGLGIAIVPKSSLHLYVSSRLVARDIDAPALETTVALIWLKNRTLSAVASNFVADFQT